MDSETKEVCKVYFDNNFFFLLRGESRRVKAEIITTESGNPSDKNLVFFAKGWNTDKATENVELR